jgi:hypothetical protein
MRRLVRLTAGGVLVLVALNGCGLRRPACMTVAALSGAVPLAVGGGVGTHNIEKGPTPNGQVAAGAAAGAVAGGLIGLLIGYFVCPEEEVAPPPPPPAPPPPPPPPVRRRGG